MQRGVKLRHEAIEIKLINTHEMRERPVGVCSVCPVSPTGFSILSDPSFRSIPTFASTNNNIPFGWGVFCLFN